jgi:uncharacterized protein (TIGR00369 family)
MPDTTETPRKKKLVQSPDGQWEDGNVCIGCGDDNPQGLHLEFAWDGDLMTTTWQPRPEHQGWKGYVHGGMLGVVLDEVMAQSVNRSGYLVPTAEMTVRFRRPAPADAPLRATATRPHGRRLITVQGEIRDMEGNLIAEATAKFLPGTGLPEESR